MSRAALEGRARAPAHGGRAFALPPVHAGARRRRTRDPKLDLDQLRVLVVNAGSSSLKVSLVGADDTELASHEFKASAGRFKKAELETAITGIKKGIGVDAVGHRVVQGDPRHSASVRVDAKVVAYLHSIEDLAPLHMPAAISAIQAVRKLLPRAPAVACFDTSFHSGMPPAAATYAIPAKWRQRHRIRRYGFHGFSHAYAARRAAELLGRPLSELRVVTCHLGSGASLAAVQGGRSVDTTMGFTPLEGLVMATRSGSVDPGLVLWLEEHVGTPPAELAATLEHRSGLLGLAGTADMRVVLERAAADDAVACLALDVYVHRLRAAVAAMAAAMDGMDALVFTGGVGENAPAVRQRAADGLSFLGVEVDPERNISTGDREIG